ncbi:hypothetical protein [Nocardia carnea]|uniref:Uncharacterized protein n=1 Tax=Nocardia carnea TaxID=37328 RepID=A0ABW7TPR1_9NOCA|nr:hypothetical protein [Nocardia carnea]
MTAYSDDTTPPALAEDGETILMPLRGRTADGVHYHGVEELHPGDPGYDELFPIARDNPVEQLGEPERPVDPDTMAAILRDSGLDRFDDKG